MVVDGATASTAVKSPGQEVEGYSHPAVDSLTNITCRIFTGVLPQGEPSASGLDASLGVTAPRKKPADRKGGTHISVITAAIQRAPAVHVTFVLMSLQQAMLATKHGVGGNNLKQHLLAH